MALIELIEAAELLGVTPDELNAMRGRKEIFAVRDGTNWKFKPEEIERVLALRRAQERSSGSGLNLDLTLAATSGGSGLDADLDEVIDIGEGSGKLGDAASVLNPDVRSSGGPGSTVIGQRTVGGEDVLDFDKPSGILDPGETGTGLGDAGADLDFDLRLDDEFAVTTDPKVPRKEAPVGKPPAETSAPRPAEDSEILLDLEPVAGEGTDLKLADSGLESSVLGSTPKGPSKPTAEETGDLGGMSLSDEDDILLDGDVRLDLSDDDLEISLSPSSSRLRVGEGSELRLAPSDTDVKMGHQVDLDAGGSGISLDIEGSGINLESPSDSGISLERTPPDILVGGDSLELGEAEFGLDDGLADLDDATNLQGDADFLLTPVEGDMFEESDSGSQVIALDSEEFDDSKSTLIAGDADLQVGEGALAAEDAEEPAVLAGAPAMHWVPEASYSIWNVLGLGAISIILGLTGIMVFDVVRNIWSWDQPYSLNSTLMDAITGAFGR